MFPLNNGVNQARNEAVTSHKIQANQHSENNNLHMPLIHFTENANSVSSTPNFGGMSNDQIQNYLISKFQDMEVMKNKQFYQNSNAFPNIPPLTNHYSNSDIASLMNHKSFKENHSSNEDIGNVAQAMSVGQSQNSLYSTSQPTTTSNDSSPDGTSSDESIPFIMPLSHKATLTATANDGRVRLIVPVSPSESFSEINAEKHEAKDSYAATLKVPSAGHSLAPTGPITRTTSEKVPNHSETMTAVRAQWARHTTK